MAGAASVLINAAAIVCVFPALFAVAVWLERKGLGACKIGLAPTA